MGQSQSTKNAPTSNYAPRGAASGVSSSSSLKQKKTSPKVGYNSRPASTSSRKSKKGGREEETRPVPHVPPVTRSHHTLPSDMNRRSHTHSYTTGVTHVTTERSVALPSRQFSLTKQTSSGSTGSSSMSSGPAKHGLIEKYFNKYKDKEDDAILAEGMERFCVDLSVDPTEFIVLVLAWKFEASQMCRFTREEFINGCRKMKAHDSQSLKNRFPELLKDARGKNFKDLYQFTFSFGLDHSTGQRSLPIDMAIPLWELVFTQDKPAILDRWFEFLRLGDVRGISRDTWNMFLPFCETISPDLSNYDESEAWPSLFDDFVEWELSK